MTTTTPHNNYNGVAQIPLNVPFTAHNTAKDIVDAAKVDLTGKVIVITGGYVGLGLEATRALVRTNATIVLGARRLDTAQNAVKDLIDAGAKIEIEQLDLSQRESVVAFAQKFLASDRPLDILINNAGIGQGQGQLLRDAHGQERIISTNHLGHFVLTALLFPALKRATGGVPRVVNTTSLVARIANVPQLIEDPDFAHHDFEGFLAYSQSKAAQVLFTVELDARARAANIPLQVFAVHPGLIVETEIVRDVAKADLDALNEALNFRDDNGNILYDPEVTGVKTIEQGASSIVFAAIYPQLDQVTSGVFIDNNNIVGLVGPDVAPNDFANHGIQKAVTEQASAAKVWAWSEQVTTVPFHVE